MQRMSSDTIETQNAQVLLAKRLLEEHGWKVIENKKSTSSNSPSTIISSTNNVEMASTSLSSVSTSKLPTVDIAVETSTSSSAGTTSAVSTTVNVLTCADVTVNSTTSSLPKQYSSSFEKKMKRTISNTDDNVILVSGLRNELTQLFNRPQSDSALLLTHNFVLPSMDKMVERFREDIFKDLIETSTLMSLEQSGHLNWWYDRKVCQRLLPLVTSGDGNCLLHAVSLALWGIHDRQLTLRKQLYDMLTNGVNCEGGNENVERGRQMVQAFKRRWRYNQEAVNRQSDLVLSEAEWQREWENIIKLASLQPRTNDLDKKQVSNGSEATNSLQLNATKNPVDLAASIYESLEEIHIFALSHVIRRPIIVISDTILRDLHGEDLAPIFFGGIYLPLELPPHAVFPYPIVLAFDSAHFSPVLNLTDFHKQTGLLGDLGGLKDIVFCETSDENAFEDNLNSHESNAIVTNNSKSIQLNTISKDKINSKKLNAASKPPSIPTTIPVSTNNNSELKLVIPLVNKSFEPLPIHFLVDPIYNTQPTSSTNISPATRVATSSHSAVSGTFNCANTIETINNGTIGTRVSTNNEVNGEMNSNETEMDVNITSIDELYKEQLNKHFIIEYVSFPYDEENIANNFSQNSINKTINKNNTIPKTTTSSAIANGCAAEDIVKMTHKSGSYDDVASLIIRDETVQDPFYDEENTSSHNNNNENKQDADNNNKTKNGRGRPKFADAWVNRLNSLKKRIKKSNSLSPFKKVTSTISSSGDNGKYNTISVSEFKMKNSKPEVKKPACNFRFKNLRASSAKPPASKNNISSKPVNSSSDNIANNITNTSIDANQISISSKSIACAKLMLNTQSYHIELLKNYLLQSFDRYNNINNSNLIEDEVDSLVATECINDGCYGLGSSSTSYLCYECYEKHMNEEIDMQNGNTNNTNNNNSIINKINNFKLRLFENSSTGNKSLSTVTTLPSNTPSTSNNISTNTTVTISNTKSTTTTTTVCTVVSSSSTNALPSTSVQKSTRTYYSKNA